MSDAPQLVRVPMAEPGFLGQPGEEMREGVRVGWIAESSGEYQAVPCPVLAGLEAFHVVHGLVSLDGLDQFGGEADDTA
nr:hypothetical protein [Nonomuraea lactucae]